MKEHFLYVMGREEGPVKVGITSSPAARLATIQTGCHFKIDILYLKQCRDRQHALWHENNFHVVQAENRLAGEWFDMEAVLALESVDTAFDLELWHEEEDRQEYISACLNLWPWAGDDGSHTHH